MLRKSWLRPGQSGSLGLLDSCLLEEGIHGLVGKKCVTVFDIIAFADLPDGEQSGDLVGRKVLTEDRKGFLFELLFCFDGGVHDSCWKYSTTKSAGFKRLDGRPDHLKLAGFDEIQDHAQGMGFQPDARLRLIVERTTECADVRVNSHVQAGT